MKKIFLFALLATTVTVGNAQTKKSNTNDKNKPVINNKIVPVIQPKTISPITTNAPTGNNSQQKSTNSSEQNAQAVDNAPYIITGARVTIKTGNDSKEYPSKIQLFLFPTPATTYTYDYTLGQLNYTNHMVVSSSTELGLTPLYQQQIPWPVYYSAGYSGTNKPSQPFKSGAHNWMLDDVLRQGFRLLIAYRPNIALDAWEIKEVTVKLEIKKADGTPHPTLNNKKIVFTIMTPPLGVPTGMALVCEADKNFVPTTNYLTKDILIDK